MFDRSSFRHFFRAMFASPPPQAEDEQHWSQFAQSLSLGPFIMWLANHIADRLISRAQLENRDINHVIGDAATGKGKLQHRAEEFLHQQHIDCDPTQERRINVFRHLIALRLRHLK